MAQGAETRIARVDPVLRHFADDGLVPNNPLPFIVYPRAIDLGGARDPAAVIEAVFSANGWGDMWRNGIYPFVHYHSQIHEVLGVARGSARVCFGGSRGEEFAIAAGDVAVLPAGTGHQRVSASPDLLVVGAYPPAGTYDLCRATREDHARARTTIPQVPLPDTDPVYGRAGPLIGLWRP
jgi:uncharacterized protein YjlB